MAVENKHSLVSYQPFRLLFQLSYAGIIIFCLPYFTMRALIPFFRPHATWSAKQTFMTRLLYRLLDITSRVGITERLTLEPGKQGERFQIVKPSTRDVYRGLLEPGSTGPAIIGGTWYPHAPRENVKFKTIYLYFHGGAFVEGDGRDPACGPIAKRLLEKGGADAVFCVQYRLSGRGGLNPFPAALQDALSSYLFLLNDLHIPASQIVVAGDSAGGNLTLALLLYIHNFGAAIKLPTPKCAVLLSPWVAPFLYEMDNSPHRDTDFIPESYAKWGANAYAGSWPNARSDPYITQLGNPFPTPVPIFANVGSAELISEHIIPWAEEMRAIDGNVLELHQEEGAVHDTFLTGNFLGFEKTSWEVAAKVGEFVARH
ncbi:alpha/beta hydrolase fold-3 domain-containing protein [Hypoxylon sp. NC1633]|nr:alpha/beta hydrolase fold-3 domain-containing protein [Hypoxylon sp. NC1633]